MRSAPSASAVVAVNLIAHGTWGWLEPAQPTPRLNQLCGASPEGYSSLDVLTLNILTRGRQRVTRVINPKRCVSRNFHALAGSLIKNCCTGMN